MSGFKNSTPTVSDDPNAMRFGFTPESENWNGRFAGKDGCTTTAF
ncbi:hypothetical protein [Chlorogloeopsis fritschii]